MRKPVPPASFTSKDPAALTDLKRLRDHCQDLLDWIDAAAPALAGDVTGDSDANEVTSIQGRPVDDGLPGSTGDVVTWDGSKLALATPSAGGSLAGDVTGALGSNLVSEIQGKTVDVGLPGSASNVVLWDGAILKLAGRTGSPFVDNWGTPSSSDDEFDSGSDDMGVRGWECWNVSDNLAMTRAGNVSISTLPPTNQYRSTRYGTYMALQIPAGKFCVFLKPYVGGSAATAYLKFGRPWQRVMYDFGSFGPHTDSPILADCILGLIQHGGVVGATPVGTPRSIWYLGTDASRPRWGFDTTVGASSTNIPPASDAFACSSLLNTDQLCTYELTSGIQHMWCMDSIAGATMGKYETSQSSAGLTSSITRAGFAVNHSLDIHAILIDHFRMRATGWFGLT